MAGITHSIRSMIPWSAYSAVFAKAPMNIQSPSLIPITVLIIKKGISGKTPIV